MKITVGLISKILFIIGGLYLSIFEFIIPVTKNPMLECTVLSLTGFCLTFVFALLLIYHIVIILNDNWNKGFNINLKFNKNKE